MSALPLKADIDRRGGHVRLVPKAAVSNRSKAALFDHLVGELLEMQGNVEAKRLGGLKIDY
jgi:hypothetical protein